MTVLMIGEVPNLTEEIYGGMVGQMMPLVRAAKGFVSHAGGPNPNGGWRVVEVWESEEDGRTGSTRTSDPTSRPTSFRSARTTRSTRPSRSRAWAAAPAVPPAGCEPTLTTRDVFENRATASVRTTGRPGRSGSAPSTPPRDRRFEGGVMFGTNESDCDWGPERRATPGAARCGSCCSARPSTA